MPTIIEKNGVEPTRSFHRHVLQPGTVGVGTDQLTDTDISGEDVDVRTIAMLHGLMQLKSHIIKLVNDAIAAGIATAW